MNPYLEKCLPYLRKAFVKVGFIHCHPYSWSDSRGQPAVNRKRWARTHWYLNVAVIFTYCAFVVCRTTQVFLSPSASLAKKFYMAFVSLYYMLAALVCVTVVTTRKDFVPFLRGFIAFLQDALAKGHGTGPREKRKVKACHLLWASFYYSQWFLLGAITAFNIVQPTSPQHLSSLFIRTGPNNTISIPISVTLASTIFQLYIQTCIAQGYNLTSGVLILFMFTVPDFLAIKPPTMKTPTKYANFYKNSDGSNEVLVLRSQLRTYRCLQLLTDGFNGLFATYNGMLHGMILTFIVLCAYGSMRTEGVMAIVQGYAGFWCLVSYLQGMNNFAEINRSSRAFLRSVRMCSNGNKCAGGELRSFKELRVKGGSAAFYFDKQLVLTVIGIVLIQSANLLILN